MTSRNGRFLKGGFSGLMIAAAIFCGASAARADYSDENIATTDDSVRRLEVGGKSVYVFTNAASPPLATDASASHGRGISRPASLLSLDRALRCTRMPEGLW